MGLQIGGAGSLSLTELASGVDAFYLSGRAALPDRLLTDLATAKNTAQETGTAVAFSVGGDDFFVAATGLLKYRFRLDHPRGVLALSPSHSLPAIRIQPRAAF